MHPLRSAAVSIAVILVLCPPLAATSPSIGVFLDRNCTMCSGTATLLVPFTFYIAARLEPSLDGISGAEFRVLGLPASWNTIYVPMVVEPSPGLLVVGDPFGSGVNVAFASGCSSTGGCVPLFTCYVTPFATEPNVRMSIRFRPTPWNCGALCCPILWRCDPPEYTVMCVLGGEAVFNGPPCTVGVEQATWTQVRRLYD